MHGKRSDQVIERLTSKNTKNILLVGGKFAFETKDAYTMIEHHQRKRLFYVNSYPN